LNDIREGKFTLPLIHALESIHANEASLILDAVKKSQFTEDFFYNIGSLVARTGGIEYAEKQMEQYRQKAIEALSIFADSEIKEALLNLLEFTIQRKK
jgi:octaprenyl-diphosphate synthase